MTFEVGETVTLSKSLGGKGYYYYDPDIVNVPLGTKATIELIWPGKRVCLRLPNGDRLHAHPDELKAREERVLGEEQKKELDSLLESTSTEEMPEEASKGAFYRIKSFFGFKPIDPEEEKRKFKPKFNVREEFAVWIDTEFPELKRQNFSMLGNYEVLGKRKDEVYRAAKLACKHGIKTAESCVKGEFKRSLRRLNQRFQNDYEFRRELIWLINYIEYVSPNLSVGVGRTSNKTTMRWTE